MNALSFQRCDAASGKDIDREIYRERARVEQVQRPQIDGASGQVSTARGLPDNAGSAGRVDGFSHAVVLPRDGRMVRHTKDAEWPPSLVTGSPAV